MDDLEYIVQTAFAHESEVDREFYRQQMLSAANPEWIKEFAKKLRQLKDDQENVPKSP